MLSPRACLTALALATAALLTACLAPSSGTPQCPTDTAGIQQQILVPRCATAGCHTSPDPQLGLDLGAPDLEQRLINAPSVGCAGNVLVAPGNPDGSLLYHKVADDAPPCGSRMPAGADPLSADQIACLRQWIAGLSPLDGGAGGDAGLDAAADTAADAGPEAAPCPAGQDRCNGSCVDTQTNAANCGACGTACVTGQTCVAGQCACGAGLTLCNGACVDTQTSGANCGSCGRACTGSDVCAGGTCTGTCPNNTTNCNGSCVDTQTSGTDCGSCGHACPAGMSCAGGSCACPAGTMACSAGCVNTQTDSSNCGGCNNACPAGATCASGACACGSGLTDCNGACVDPQTDPANCGACGHACAAGQVCSAGACSCGRAVSFANDVQTIFTRSCVTGCHGGVRPPEGLLLSSGNAYTNLVNVASTECGAGRMRVAPGDSANSYLYNKVAGTNLCSGSQMPLTGSLTAAQVDTIRGWICEGAPNN